MKNKIIKYILKINNVINTNDLNKCEEYFSRLENHLENYYLNMKGGGENHDQNIFANKIAKLKELLEKIEYSQDFKLNKTVEKMCTTSNINNKIINKILKEEFTKLINSIGINDNEINNMITNINV